MSKNQYLPEYIDLTVVKLFKSVNIVESHWHLVPAFNFHNIFLGELVIFQFFFDVGSFGQQGKEQLWSLNIDHGTWPHSSIESTSDRFSF